jgi:hypothetical protein
MILEAALGARGARATPEEFAGLRRIRARRRLVWITLAVALPSIYLVSLVWSAAFDFMMAVAILAFGAATVWHSMSRCPRCGGLFNAKWYWGSIWASACLHCGLPLTARP